ncbi:hypothetical protein [Falsiroseomonas oryzae]|uniref:hypothetical protein n=1 Tax=Falsiroseomonas oryzae TaxID=2766473 RepID=UPI0022EA32EE|nr:hypothetical protein [Roseomonas sp. MO-31]
MTTGAEDGPPLQPPAEAPRRGMADEAVAWGFRLLAGREPLSAAEFAAFKAQPDLNAMRRAFTNVPEFHAFFDAVLTGHPAYRMPLFMLRPSEVDGLEWRFQPPDLEQPVSQLCTFSQFADPAYAEITGAMGFPPGRGRYRWEQAWIVSVLATEGLIGPGRRGLALQAGRERVAALLASRGVEIVATSDEVTSTDPAETRRTWLFFPEVVHIEEFDRLVSFVPFELSQLGRLDAGEFDFCWSMGMPGRLRSIEAALAFFEASLAPLKPGGLALHSFAFNLTSDAATLELPDLVLLRRRDIEALAERLAASGHRLLPFNTHPGCDKADERVRSEAGGAPGIRQRHGNMVATSFGLAIRKAG